MATTNGTFQWSSVTQVFVKVNKVMMDADHETFEVVLTNRHPCFSSCIFFILLTITHRIRI